MTDKSVWMLGAKCAMLKELRLSRCANLTDAGVDRIARECRALQILHLSHCKQVRYVTTALILSIFQKVIE